MIGRLADLFEGPDSMAPWAPPAMPEALHGLLPWRAWDEGTELYVNAASHGFVCELPPFAGIDAETLGALAGVLADAAPERCTLQVIHWASPRFGAPLAAWAAARRQAGGLHREIAERREALFAHAGWRALHPGGPPFTCSDYRVFVTAGLAGVPTTATETSLGAFRRALEGTLASSGAQARRIEPDELLSLAAEWIAPSVGQAGPAETNGSAATQSPAATQLPAAAQRPAAPQGL
ncbi:MAG: TraC family protein, partial [Rhodospirillales bacterium]|nr:TraC family protein [Rhodospirillales bacterium]